MEDNDIPAQGRLSVVPDLIWIIRGPALGWGHMLGSVVADLDAGVEVVCVFDPGSNASCIFGSDQQPYVVEHKAPVTRL